MNAEIRIERLTEQNFKDYESLTSCQTDGGCYCSFWHQKWASMDDWKTRQKEAPLLNRETVLDKVRSGFHPGVLVYKGTDLAAWISVGPLTDFYWTWKRLIQVGESAAKTTAGITCIAIAEKFRGQGLLPQILSSLKDYGKIQGWTRIEGYPFEESAFKKQGKNVAWPGHVRGFESAGFQKLGAHWLNHPDWERAIYETEL